MSKHIQPLFLGEFVMMFMSLERDFIKYQRYVCYSFEDDALSMLAFADPNKTCLCQCLLNQLLFEIKGPLLTSKLKIKDVVIRS